MSTTSNHNDLPSLITNKIISMGKEIIRLTRENSQLKQELEVLRKGGQK